MSTTSGSWLERVHVPQGFPKPETDTAPSAVFLALFFLGAISNMIIFRRNKSHGHNFFFNGLCVGFCMARVVTLSLRLAWIYNIDHRGLAIAATIFVAAGVLLLFIINLIFAQRILRGLHPHIGWHKSLKAAFIVLYAILPLMLALVVTGVVQSFFATDPEITKIDVNLQRGGSTYIFFFSLLPIPITLFALFYPKHREPEHFGEGHWWHKSAVLLIAAVLLSTGAGFRTATLFIGWNKGYQQNPPWWNAKWFLYFFQFTVEIIVVVMYLVFRIDQLFYVPDGSKGPGDYTSRPGSPLHDRLVKAEKQNQSDSGRDSTSSV